MGTSALLVVYLYFIRVTSLQERNFVFILYFSYVLYYYL